MKNDKHVVFDFQTSTYRCKCCGEEYKPNLPAPINIVVAIGQAFRETHLGCQPCHETK